ncbi:Fasciclin-like arabinogalactan protein [Actinidia chinensis var. chinensis]|uniref:Fasciclin-like arabinogalactan protein n=1 Tax=Actinidia chinensis var. chinensis TaxID=1590841 RepID=A0A2R6QD20_ACTCC|nr:Fasciclin-like arabinogalactan protein [Actinidia chinensis var. chinensis]
MQVCPPAAGPIVLSLLFLSLFSTEAHNITRILNNFPDFSTFNHYLTATHLAQEINNRQTITVCAVDNAAMADLLSKHLSIYAIKNVLSFHVLLDYFGAKKLHQITNGTALAATMFQATGTASGSSGFVNITDFKGGKVGFGAEENGGKIDAVFVKSLEEVPYNISVIHISKILPSAEAEAPTPGPSQLNLTSAMSSHGCRVFAETLLASDAEKTFEDNLDGGMTVFCPGDDAFKNFLPKYKNLTAAGKQSLMEFHGVPVYQSLAMLKSNNGLMNTLATDGASKFDFTVQNDGEEVTLKTKLVTAKITGTLMDEQPVAIYTIDKVLLPKELFKAALTPAPAPAPEKEADSPKPTKKKHLSPPEPDSPAESPDEDPADQTADKNNAVRFNGARIVAVILSLLCFASLQV